MAKTIYLEIGANVAARMEELAAEFGEPSPADLVARALGFLSQIARYVDDDGVLGIEDPEDKSIVEFRFPGSKGSHGPAAESGRSATKPAAASHGAP